MRLLADENLRLLTSHGVILLRLGELTLDERLARLVEAWAVVEANPTGKFIVVTQKKVRVRDLATDEEEDL